jgi:deazaflavin-dependent oxidoreductase (nitroreductase family)
MYRGGRPNRLARAMNGMSARMYAAGVLTLGGRGVTLQVRGRRSGRPVTFPLVLVRHEGDAYLVSMLGPDAQWVRNVHADGGRAVLLRHGPHPVRLVDVPVGERAPILRRFLALAPGARPHVAVDRHAPVEAFAAVAAQHPVFRVDPRDDAGDPP